MGENIFSLEAYYRTQPPEHIGEIKVSSVLEYLAFSGTPIYISASTENEKSARLVASSVVVDVLDDFFLLESHDFKAKGVFPLKVAVSFGYKRKRAFFETFILRTEKNAFALA